MRLLRILILTGLLAVTATYAFCGLIVLSLRRINPPTTMVQIQRRFEAIREHRPYQKRYEFIPLRRISPNLQHAAVAAEDGRFRQHHGFDWVEMQKVLEDDMNTTGSGAAGRPLPNS